jgi:hypothetical protein
MSKNIAVRFVSEDCYLVPSDSIEGHSYVLRRKYGQWTCSCRGFILSCLKRNTNCKHLTLLFSIYPELDPRLHEQPISCTPLRVSNPLGESRWIKGTTEIVPANL